MTTLDDIEKAVTALPADQLAKFRAWFEELEAARFDQRIERDAEAGRLDHLADQALADFHAGRARELWGISPVPPSGKPTQHSLKTSASSPTRTSRC